MRTIHSEIGSIAVREVPLPEGISVENAIYLPSGRIVLNYFVPGEEKDRVHIASLADDGSGFQEIFDGIVPLKQTGNGFRIMPFQNNQKALIGDYVLECEPDLDHANPSTSRMVPIHYPDELLALPGLWKAWSEIIIHPDNEHMGFNGLGNGVGVYVGKLRRTEEEYVLDDVQTISVSESKPDPDHDGCILPGPMRGGEIKAFLNGGRAVSLVGAGQGAGDSVVQALDSENFYEITKTPGYDETTIFSPDNRLGLTMSTRFSPKTSAAFIGLIPRRGNMQTKSALTAQIYQYGVAEVRNGREGNIGPALIDIEKSMHDPGYLGTDLSDPAGEWAYYSPMSWDPTGKKALWNEGQKKTIGSKRRVMMAELLDWKPSKPIPAYPFPEIPYALPGIAKAGSMMGSESGTKIAGHFSGTAATTVETKPQRRIKTVYENFSDDGRSFLNGWEASIPSPFGIMNPGSTSYDAKLTLTGEHTGEMDCHVVYTTDASWHTFLDKDSCGFVRYDEETIRIEDLL